MIFFDQFKQGCLGLYKLVTWLKILIVFTVFEIKIKLIKKILREFGLGTIVLGYGPSKNT